MHYQIDIYDDMGVFSGTIDTNALGQNDVDLGTQIETNNANALAGLPPNWSIVPRFPWDAMTIYFLLDKDSLFQTFYAFKDYFVGDAFANQPPGNPILVNPDETPRNTGWKDPDGVFRSPPPSEDPKVRKSTKLGTLTIPNVVVTLALNVVGKLRAKYASTRKPVFLRLANQILSALGDPKTTTTSLLTLVDQILAKGIL